jgi:periplasmic divalent cation tolerance protein
MRVVLCTAPVEIAEMLARGLVESRVVACVNIVPRVRSIYRWEGKVEEEDEALLVMKTTAERVESVIDRVRRAHPYEVPEVVALPIEEGLPEYLAWVADQVRLP